MENHICKFTTNHVAGSLSKMDMDIISNVPQGGNWKDVPSSVPSRRLEQIRESFKRGEGSRSTYYGRLSWEKPSYTISTYFNRPGNGCNIHPEEDRVITAREAARLQTFPDWYHFTGSQRSINKQIGNAFPPLVAHAVAMRLGVTNFVDLFCGAGGMSLGFELSGSQHIVSVDIDKDACATFRNNRKIDDSVIMGDLSDESTKEDLIARVKDRTHSLDALIGGPPCQGFSHAGNARNTNDERNHCVYDFIEMVKSLQPRAVVMENVPGMRTFEKGKFLADILRRYEEIGYPATVNLVKTELLGTPQRRTRLVLIATKGGRNNVTISGNLPVDKHTNIREAISDLPKPVESNEEEVIYGTEPTSDFQRMVRGHMSYGDFLADVVCSGGKRTIIQEKIDNPILSD